MSAVKIAHTNGKSAYLLSDGILCVDSSAFHVALLDSLARKTHTARARRSAEGEGRESEARARGPALLMNCCVPASF